MRLFHKTQILPRNKIRLSRSLRAQTTPYPNAGAWMKRGIVAFILLVGVGIYIFAKPHADKQAAEPAPKQILGEQEASEPQYASYTIKKGDTLFNLAQRYSVSWQTLAQINDLQAPFTLKIGQQIKVPQN